MYEDFVAYIIYGYKKRFSTTVFNKAVAVTQAWVARHPPHVGKAEEKFIEEALRAEQKE